MESEMINVYKGEQYIEESIETVKSELSQYLQCENLNFLFGSGCSSFIDDSGEQIAISTMKGLFADFFEANPDFNIDGVNPKDKCDNNLELLMDYLVSIKMASNLLPIPENVDEKINILQKYIKNAIIEGQKSEEVVSIYKDFYTKMVNTSSKNPINIFTTNYDLFNEKALDALGFYYNNGFIGTFKRKFNPNSYNYVFVENLNLNKDVWGKLSNYYNLFKIHGSINWVVEDNEIIERPVELCNEARVMIYPTPQKDRSTLMTPYSDLMRNMQQILSKNNSVLITIGYSFSDDHINRIILNSLSNPSFKLIVLGKSEEIKKLISLHDKRIMVINSDNKVHYFHNFVNILMPDIDEDLKKEMILKDGFEALKEFVSKSGDDQVNGQ